MYQVDDYSERELKIINHRLNLSIVFRLKKPLDDLRVEAMSGHELEHVKVFDDFGTTQNRDLLVLRHIRHTYTNYESYWRLDEPARVRHILWIVGFIKAAGMLQRAYPELATAIDYEVLNRITTDDRILLRDIIFRLLDMTIIQAPTVPLSDLCGKAVESLNKNLSSGSPEAQPVSAESCDPLVQRSIKKQILLDYIQFDLTDEPKRLGLGLLDGYNRALARERLYGKALDAFSNRYPELTEVCEERMSMYREQTAVNLDWSFRASDLTLVTADLKDIYTHVIKNCSDGSMAQTIHGLQQDLPLEKAPVAVAGIVRVLSVDVILNNFSSYPKYMMRAVLLPEPRSSLQQARIRRLSLDRVQERYPELSDVIETELRLLACESKQEAPIAS